MWLEIRLPKPPSILPANWKKIITNHTVVGSIGFESSNGIQVIISELKYSDEKWWRHVSLSRKSRLPTWEDLKMVKRVFIGKDKKAIQVFPAEDEYVNIHPYVLHLFSPIDHNPLPDFRIKGLL